MNKKSRKVLGVVISLVIVILSVYAIAYGQIFNRLAGPNVTPGDGLVSHVDSTAWHILLGFGFYIQSDSLKYDFTAAGDSVMLLSGVQTVTGAKTFSESLIVSDAQGMQLGVNGQDGKLILYSEQNGTDYKVIFNPHATMTQHTEYTLPANDGDASQFLQSDGGGVLVWATPSGAGDMTKATYDINEDDVVDSAETVSHGIISNVVHDSLVANWATWLDGDASEADIHDTLVANFATSAGILAFVGDESGSGVLIFGTSPTFTTGISCPDNSISDEELDEGATFTWTGTHNFTGATVTDASFEEADINWTSTRILPFGEISQMEGNADSVDVFHIANDIVHNYVRFQNFSAQAGLICTTLNRYLMTGDADTVIYEINTETTTPDTSGIAIIIWKQSKVAGDTTRVYPTTGEYVLEASATGGVWARKTLAAGSIDPISKGDVLLVGTIAKVNAGRYAKCEIISPYAPGK